MTPIRNFLSVSFKIEWKKHPPRKGIKLKKFISLTLGAILGLCVFFVFIRPVYRACLCFCLFVVVLLSHALGTQKVASSQLVFNFVEIETSSVLIIGGQKPRSLDGFGLANGSHFKPNLGY